jgi:Ras homolog gene family, member A
MRLASVQRFGKRAATLGPNSITFQYFVPTWIEDSYVLDVEVEKRRVELELVRTWGPEDYDRIRPLSYPGAHAIILCFSIVDPESFKNIEEKWVPEVTHFCPGVPFILVGCKADLRHHRQTMDNLMKAEKRPVSKEEGEAMSKKIGAKAYLECSAKTGDGGAEVFRTIAAVAYPPKAKRRPCVIF